MQIEIPFFILIVVCSLLFGYYTRYLHGKAEITALTASRDAWRDKAKEAILEMGNLLNDLKTAIKK